MTFLLFYCCPRIDAYIVAERDISVERFSFVNMAVFSEIEHT